MSMGHPLSTMKVCVRTYLWNNVFDRFIQVYLHHLESVLEQSLFMDQHFRQALLRNCGLLAAGRSDARPYWHNLRQQPLSLEARWR